MRQCGHLGHVWDINKYGEKGIQPTKNEFVTKKGKFCCYHDGEVVFQKKCEASIK